MFIQLGVSRNCDMITRKNLQISFCFCSCSTLGDGGGGDGSSGSEENGNDGGVSTIPPLATNVQTTYDVLRGLGIVGSSAAGEDEDDDLNNLAAQGRHSLSRHSEVRLNWLYFDNTIGLTGKLMYHFIHTVFFLNVNLNLFVYFNLHFAH